MDVVNNVRYSTDQTVFVFTYSFTALLISFLPKSKSQSYGDLRLAGGGAHFGRLEVYYNDTWGTICDDSFALTEALVACKQLNLWNSTTSVRYYSQGFDIFTGPIWLDDISCQGYKTRLDNCTHRGWGSHNCDHHEDVNIACFDSTVDIPVRIVNDSILTDGRLEIYLDGIWRSVCDEWFQYRDAVVACRQLGYTGGSAEYYRVENGNGPVWLIRLDCAGTENAIGKCVINILGVGRCDRSVGLRCNSNRTEGELRLIGGTNAYGGRLEIYHNGTWGSICNNNFNHISAIVACKQLGYNSTAATFYTAANGFGNIWLDEVKCLSPSQSFFNCSRNGWGIHNCYHYQDVGVYCRGEQSVNGDWSLWSNWTQCSVNCGGGIQQRSRTCTNPLPYGFGSSCDGSDVQYLPCSSYCCTNNQNATVFSRPSTIAKFEHNNTYIWNTFDSVADSARVADVSYEWREFRKNELI